MQASGGHVAIPLDENDLPPSRGIRVRSGMISELPLVSSSAVGRDVKTSGRATMGLRAPRIPVSWKRKLRHAIASRGRARTSLYSAVKQAKDGLSSDDESKMMSTVGKDNSKRSFLCRSWIGIVLAITSILALGFLVLSQRNHLSFSSQRKYLPTALEASTVEEEYNPPPQVFQPPPSGSIYDMFGMVIPSYGGHRDAVDRFLRTMDLYCSDCARIRLLLIVPENEIGMFNEIRNQMQPKYKRLEVLSFTAVFPGLNYTLADEYKDWPQGWTGWTEKRLLEEKQAKYTYQSFKKLYGCLYLGTQYCFVQDSEGLFIRPTTIADIVGGYLKAPYILYSSNLRSDFYATKSAQELLGYKERFGWPLEEYHWVFDNNVLAELERIIRKKHPDLTQVDGHVYIELSYWFYIIHNHHKFPRYRLLETADILGDMYDVTQKMIEGADPPRLETPWEDLRWYLEVDPSLADRIAPIFVKNNFKMFKVNPSPGSLRFIELASSVVLLTSFQPKEFFELAMQGHFMTPPPVAPLAEKRRLEEPIQPKQAPAPPQIPDPVVPKSIEASPLSPPPKVDAPIDIHPQPETPPSQPPSPPEVPNPLEPPVVESDAASPSSNKVGTSGKEMGVN